MFPSGRAARRAVAASIVATLLVALFCLMSTPDTQAQSTTSLSTVRQQMLDSINAWRVCATSGVCPAANATLQYPVRADGIARPPLTLDSRLNTSAQGHSDYMVNNNCFDHQCPGEPDPWTRMANAGYSASAAGENIAAGYSTVDSVMNGFINEAPGSDGHRQNILSPSFRGVGVGWNGGCARYCNYWTQDFGSVSDNLGGGTTTSPTATPTATKVPSATPTSVLSLPSCVSLGGFSGTSVTISDINTETYWWHYPASVYPYDRNSDGKQTIRDVQMVAGNYGKPCS